MLKYVEERLGYEIEDLYGITIEEQELETEERRPRDSVDNSPVLQANVGNGIDEDIPPARLSLERDYPTSNAITTDEEASIQRGREETEETNVEIGENEGEGRDEGEGEEGEEGGEG
jgi:hypothetical protein